MRATVRGKVSSINIPPLGASLSPGCWQNEISHVLPWCLWHLQHLERRDDDVSWSVSFGLKEQQFLNFGSRIVFWIFPQAKVLHSSYLILCLHQDSWNFIRLAMNDIMAFSHFMREAYSFYSRGHNWWNTMDFHMLWIWDWCCQCIFIQHWLPRSWSNQYEVKIWGQI